MAEEHNYHKFVIECQSYVQAAKYAASKDLWLHSWTWLPAKEYAKASMIRVYINEEYLN